MAIDIPPWSHGSTCAAQALLLRRVAALGVNCHHDALRTVARRSVFNDLRIGDGCRIETGLVRPGVEQQAHVVYAAHAASHCQGNEYLARHRLDDMQDQAALVTGCRDVQKGKFVRSLVVVTGGNLDRVPGIAQGDKVDALDDPSAGDIEARNDSFCKHGYQARRSAVPPERAAGRLG